MNLRSAWWRRGAVGLAALLAVGAIVMVAMSSGDDDGYAAMGPATARAGAVGPDRYTGPQGRVGQFVVRCDYSHSSNADPIVHFGQAGSSHHAHRHDFYGALGTNARSRAGQLVRRPTTCDKEFDTAAYWHPSLYDHDVAVRPSSIAAYYRAAPGVPARTVRAFPFGLALIAGDATATTRQRGDAVGWVCGSSTILSDTPPECLASAPLHLVVTFQDCWDGEHLDAVDHRSHVAYSARGACPASHPVHVPQLTMSVAFPISGSGHDFRLASGTVYSAHADFLNAWDPAGLEREVDACIRHNVVCELASNREEEALFQHR